MIASGCQGYNAVKVSAAFSFHRENAAVASGFQVLDAACAVINNMATFDQAGIDDGYLDEIREGDKFTVEGAK